MQHRKVKVGLYGSNGHQIHGLLVDHPWAELGAVAAFAGELPEPLRGKPGVAYYESLEQMAADPEIELISLCSPRRKDQAADAIACLRAGKHVYAEKPCALTEEELDAIIETARSTGRLFHEMAGTAFEWPYAGMRELIRDGAIGEVVQVFAQKSYPYHDRRPQDEDVDGGLVLQCGVHAMRFVEHVTGRRIARVEAFETSLGNPVAGGGLKMAASVAGTLDNGGTASVIANYFNQRAFGSWGNEHLRVFGTKGFVEAVDGGKRTRLVTADGDQGELRRTETGKAADPGAAGLYFSWVIDEIRGVSAMPIALEEELHPVRMVIRAKRSAERNG